MKKVTIYTNKTCPYCKQVKETLTKEKIKFTEKDTTEDIEEWREVVSLTGMPTMPTVLYDKEYLVAGRDFPNPQQLVSILQNFKPLSLNFPNERQTLERVKTLNYNIVTAFGRLDQLLRQIETKLNTDEHKSTD